MGHPLHSQPSQEYPIRALVRVGSDSGMPPSMEGGVFNWKKLDTEDDPEYVTPGEGYKGYWWALSHQLILDPTPQQVAEERAKAGLPADEPAPQPADECHPLYLVDRLRICEGCLKGLGEMCHTPGCAFIRSRSLDLDVRESITFHGGVITRESDALPAPTEAAEGEALPEAPAEGSPSQELDSLLADYGLAFQQAGWDWRVKLDAAKAKIIEWVARSQAPSAPAVPMGGVDLDAIEYVIALAKNSSGLSPTGEEKIIEAESALSSLRAALSKLEGR